MISIVPCPPAPREPATKKAAMGDSSIVGTTVPVTLNVSDGCAGSFSRSSIPPSNSPTTRKLEQGAIGIARVAVEHLEGTLGEENLVGAIERREQLTVLAA